jgi:hypothetical protein
MTNTSSVLKKIFFFFCIVFAVNVTAQNTDYRVSMTGIGTLKIGMSQAEVEKMLNQKFVLRNALDSATSWQDSTSAKYRILTSCFFFKGAIPLTIVITCI